LAEPAKSPVYLNLCSPKRHAPPILLLGGDFFVYRVIGD
jgi:hypothetical protein